MNETGDPVNPSADKVRVTISGPDDDPRSSALEYDGGVDEALKKALAAILDADYPIPCIGWDHLWFSLQQEIRRNLGEKVARIDMQHRSRLARKDTALKSQREEYEEKITRLAHHHQEELAKLHREIVSRGDPSPSGPEDIVNAMMRVQFIAEPHDREFAKQLLSKWASAARSA